MATWGMIARGAEAVPHAVALLNGSLADEREDGAGILGAIGRDDVAVEAVLERVEGETDTLARDTMIAALGRMRSRKAIPMLARIVRDGPGDQDTRWTAADALGDIVRRQFGKQGDAIEAAIAWLDEHGL